VKTINDQVTKDPWDVFFDIAANGNAFTMPQIISKANKIKAMREPFTSYDTDVGPAGGSGIASHPSVERIPAYLRAAPAPRAGRGGRYKRLLTIRWSSRHIRASPPRHWLVPGVDITRGKHALNLESEG
jgi:hypothetical protein